MKLLSVNDVETKDHWDVAINVSEVPDDEVLSYARKLMAETDVAIHLSGNLLQVRVPKGGVYVSPAILGIIEQSIKAAQAKIDKDRENAQELHKGMVRTISNYLQLPLDSDRQQEDGE